MFSQKKKKNKGLFLLIPFALIFAVGIWMNGFTGDDASIADNVIDKEVSSDYENSNNIPVFEYDNNDAAKPDSEKKDFLNDSDNDHNDDTDDADMTGNGSEGNGNYIEQGNLTDYYLVISQNGKVAVKEFSAGNLVSEQMTGIIPDELPQYDRDSLENGMVFLSREEVDMLLENFEG